MKTFDLELRVRTFGSIITWKLLLEDSTNSNNVVLDWLQGEGYRYKKLPGYQVSDNSLEVFAGCQGIRGGNISCEIIINNNSRPNKVVANVEDRIYATNSYPI